jgi:hypothetical protein
MGVSCLLFFAASEDRSSLFVWFIDSMDAHRQRVQRLMWAATGSEPIREAFEVHLINLIEDGHDGLLYDLVFQRRYAQRSFPPVGLRYVDSSCSPLCVGFVLG